MMGNIPVTPPPASRPLSRRQQRALQSMGRRRSFLGPLLLVVAGVVALLLQTGYLHWQRTLEWYGQWWALLLIGAGVLLAAEWSIDRAKYHQDLATGTTPYLPRRAGGGVLALLVLLALFGAAVHSTHSTVFGNYGRGHGMDFLNFDMVHAIGSAYEADEAFEQPMADATALIIDNPQGDVTVSGISSDGRMHVSVHKRVYAFNEGDASEREGKLHPVVLDRGGLMTLRVPFVEGGQSDVTVSVPASLALTATTGPGQVRVSGLRGDVTVNGNRGDVDLSNLEGRVTAHMHSDEATLSAHELQGSLNIDGHTGDLNISDIKGPVTLSGNFFGTTHFEKLAGPLSYHTSRTDLQLARLTGELEFDTGSELQADQVFGPLLLKTSDRVISLDRVQGDVTIQNTNGGVTLTNVAPLGSVRVNNKRGAIDIGVPTNASFTVFASAKHGVIEDDFSLPRQSHSDVAEISGTVGQGGAAIIHLETSDGDVTLRKTTLNFAPPVPLPPDPPPFPPGAKADGSREGRGRAKPL